MATVKKTVLEIWPMATDDLKKFVSDRPGWLIDVLKNAHQKKGLRGWRDIEAIINILQFLKDTEYEY